MYVKQNETKEKMPLKGIIREVYYLLEFLSKSSLIESLAGVAQLVEHHLAKVDVEGSNPFARSTLPFLLSKKRLNLCFHFR